jgi:hypothetical protein
MRFGLAEFDELLALVAELTEAGRISDALYAGLSQPQLAVSGRQIAFWPGEAAGESHASFAAEFLAAQVATGEAALEELAWVEDNAEPPPLPDDLDEALRGELGLGLVQLGRFFGTLIDYGIETAAGIVIADHRLLIDLLRGVDDEWDEEMIVSALDRFCLQARPDFLDPPQPHGRADVYPWRANRSLSLVRRPLVRRGDEIAYGIRHLFNSQMHLAGLIETGRFPARTEALRRLLGRHGDRLGRRFEQAVRALFSKHGYDSRLRVKSVEGRLLTADGSDLGDIDILVADPANQRLVVVDAKGLGVALNADDIVRQSAHLRRTVGRVEGRADWLRGNLDAAAAEFADPRIVAWNVEALIVSDRVLPAAHFAHAEVPILSYGLLKQQLTQRGAW